MTTIDARLRALCCRIDSLCLAIVARRAPPIRRTLKPIRDELYGLANEIQAEREGVTVAELFGRCGMAVPEANQRTGRYAVREHLGTRFISCDGRVLTPEEIVELLNGANADAKL